MTTVEQAKRKRIWFWVQVVACFSLLTSAVRMFAEEGRLLTFLPGLAISAVGVAVCCYAMTRNGRRLSDRSPVAQEQSRLMTSGVFVTLIGTAWMFVAIVLLVRDRF